MKKLFLSFAILFVPDFKNNRVLLTFMVPKLPALHGLKPTNKPKNFRFSESKPSLSLKPDCG